jgi:Glutaminase
MLSQEIRDRVDRRLQELYERHLSLHEDEVAGYYDIPAKSGVSGGVLAVVPGKLGIGVFSPGLDAYGNSVRGTAVCEEISERLGLHIFADAREDTLLGPGR